MTEHLIVVEIPHQFAPKVWLTNKEDLVKEAERKLNGRGESLITSWYRSDLEEYTENEMTDVVEAFAKYPVNEIFEIDGELVTEIPANYEYNKAVDTILHDNNTGGVIATVSDLKYWQEDYKGHQQTAMRSALAKFLQDYDWVELPEEVETNA